MNAAPPADPDRPGLCVGVFDEPELIVSGVGGLLTREGPAADVVTIAPDSPTAAVDVVLCDPVGRDVQLEEYLDLVAGLTSAPVLVFTWSSSRSTVRRAMAAGARGFVPKSASGRHLAAAVSAVHRGETVAPPALEAAPNGTPLSAREAEVLELICRGLSNLEIADQLFVSVNSVKTYVRQIYQKIDVSRRAQAVGWGLAHGF
jgi:two-component system, NarL family, response regulator LiaR